MFRISSPLDEGLFSTFHDAYYIILYLRFINTAGSYRDVTGTILTGHHLSASPSTGKLALCVAKINCVSLFSCITSFITSS